jgi:multiple sugar transport system substrate-binding protein
MKLKLSIWAVPMVILTLVLSACGGAATPTGQATSAPAGEATTPAEPAAGGEATATTAAEPAAGGGEATPTPGVVFDEQAQPNQKQIVWMVRTGIDENTWQKSVVLPDFAKAKPDIFVKVLSIRQEDIAVKREAMIAAKEPLHVWSSNWGGDGFASDRARGLLADLTPLIERDKFDTSDYLPDVWKIYQSEGKQWGIPFLTTGTYIYYNKKLFDDAKVPYPPTSWDDESWTWDKYVETAKALTKNYDDPNTAVFGAGGGYGEYLEGYPGMWGHQVWTPEALSTGLSDKVTVADETSIKAFQEFHDLVYVDKVAPEPAATAAMDQLGGAFQTGRMAMFISGGWGHWSFNRLIDDPNGFCWGAAPLPMGAPGAKDRSINYTDPWVITAGMDQENTDLAWEFVKFLASPEQAKKYTDTTGTPPTRASLLTSYYDRYTKCMKPEDMKTVFEGAFSHGHESANHLLVKYDELAQTWQNLLTPFWADPEAKAADVLPQVETEVNDALQRIREETQQQ